MEFRTIVMIAIFVGFFVTTHFVSKLYDQMRPPRRNKAKKNPTARLEVLTTEEDKLISRQLVNKRNTIIEETDFTLKKNLPPEESESE